MRSVELLVYEHPSRDGGAEVRRELTADDVASVALNTLREGFTHRRWPPEVVLAFARAEVVRERAEPGRAPRRLRLSEALMSAFGHLSSSELKRQSLP